MSNFPVGLDPQVLALRSDFARSDSRVGEEPVESSALFSANPVNRSVIEYDAGNLNDVSEIARKVLSNIGA